MRTEPTSEPSQRPLWQRLSWFAALWLAGVGTVGLLALVLHLWLAPR